MSAEAYPMLMGAIAMASSVATLFFLRFWRQTGDPLFLFFAAAFVLDAASRVALGVGHPSEELDPLFLPRAPRDVRPHHRGHHPEESPAQTPIVTMRHEHQSAIAGCG